MFFKDQGNNGLRGNSLKNQISIYSTIVGEIREFFLQENRYNIVADNEWFLKDFFQRWLVPFWKPVGMETTWH